MKKIIGSVRDKLTVESDCPFGSKYEKYWKHRHDLFCRFDEGIKIDEEGLYSVKPELVAREIAELIPGTNVTDALCGLGGVSIALAQLGKKVTAIEKDRNRLEFARHNARIYGVEENICFIEADALQLLPTMQTDAVFLDPSWGGPDYALQNVFRLPDFVPDGNELLKAACVATNSVFLCGPQQLELNNCSSLWTVINLVKHFMWGRVICVTARIQSTRS